MRKSLLSATLVSMTVLSLVVACGDDDDSSAPGSQAGAAGTGSPGAGGTSSPGPGGNDSGGSHQGSGTAGESAGGAGGAETGGAAAGGAAAGGAGGVSGNEPNYFCYVKDQGQCAAMKIFESNRELSNNTCMTGGGTVLDGCPTNDGLAGCCTQNKGTPQVAETCVYGTSAPALTQTKCDQIGGVWSDLPFP